MEGETMDAKAMTKEEKAVVSQQCEKTGASFAAYLAKSTSNYFTSDDGIVVLFDKPSIQTEFWFGEHGSEDLTDEARAAEKSVEFFINENMGGLRTYRRAWDNVDEYGHRTPYHYPYIKRGAYSGQSADCALGIIEFGTWNGESQNYRGNLEGDHGFRKLTESETERLKEAEERRDALFLKRLKSYLKRYGLSKVNCRTFWADR